jgi:hypothetical protein
MLPTGCKWVRLAKMPYSHAAPSRLGPRFWKRRVAGVGQIAKRALIHQRAWDSVGRREGLLVISDQGLFYNKNLILYYFAHK